MSLGVLNNISALYAENNLNQTQGSLQKTLNQLSSGSRINSGADDAAGLSIVDGLAANNAALTQSATNASQGVGLLQVADGALSQVTNLLNRAVTLSTEASNGTLNTSQRGAADAEFQSILGEITNIGSTTTYNGQQVFGTAAGAAGQSSFAVVTGDGTTSGTSIDTLVLGFLSSANVGDTTGKSGTGSNLSASNLLTSGAAQTALTAVYTAVQNVASERGYVGAQVNTLNAVSNVETTQSENIAAAQNSIQATDYGQASSNLSKFNILNQTGISALAQANSSQQAVLKLLQ